jgi:hypothetical protein
VEEVGKSGIGVMTLPLSPSLSVSDFGMVLFISILFCKKKRKKWGKLSKKCVLKHTFRKTSIKNPTFCGDGGFSSSLL